MTPRTLAPSPSLAATVFCPHCKREVDTVLDTTQHPRFQKAKCPNCSLSIGADIVRAAADAANA